MRSTTDAAASRPARWTSPIARRAARGSNGSRSGTSDRPRIGCSERAVPARGALVDSCPVDRVRRLQTAQRRRLDAAGVETAVNPVTGEEQVVEAAAVGAQPVMIAAGERLDVAVRRIGVRAPVLGGKAGLRGSRR